MWMAAGCSGWTKRDTALEIASQLVVTEDWHQTENCLEFPAGACHEQNPIIGQRGERVSPVTYFIAIDVIHAVVAAALPRGRWRTAFQIATSALELANVLNNAHDFATFGRPMF